MRPPLRSLARLALPAALSALGACKPPPPPPVVATAPPPSDNPCDKASALRGSITRLREAGKLERAARLVEKADKMCPDSAPETWAVQVALLTELGRHAEAKNLATIIDSAPKAPDTAKHAAAAAREQIERIEKRLNDPNKQKTDKARADSRKSLREAEAAEGAGDTAKALEKYRRSWDEWPSAQALAGAALAAKKLGNKEDAQRYFDRTIVELEKAAGKTLELAVPNGFSGSVTSVSWSPTGKRLAVAHGDGVSILDTGTWRERVRLFDLGKPRAVAFSADGAQIATGSDDRGVRVWDAATGALLAVFKEHTGEVASVVFSPNGKLLASGAKDSTIRVWDLGKGVITRVFSDHTNDVNSVAFSPDNKRLASGSQDNTVRLFDLVAGQLLRTLDDHTLYVTGVAFSPDGKQLASSSWDNSVRLWDMKIASADTPPKVLSKVFKDHTDRVTTVAFAAQGKLLGSGSWDNTVRLWDPATGAVKQVLKGHAQWVTSVSFSPDGKQVATGSWDTTVRIWDTSTGASLQVLKEIADRATLAAFSPDGTSIAAASPDRTVRMWVPGAKAFTKGSYEEYVGRLKADALSPDRSFRVSTTMAGLLTLLRAQDSAPLATLRTVEGKDAGYVLASDGHIDFMGTEPCAAHALPLCRVGSISLPFVFCEDRFYSPGLLGKLLAKDDSWAQPEAENAPLECPGEGN
jgi:DNA-binding beta-propeller fold protein YncE